MIFDSVIPSLHIYLKEMISMNKKKKIQRFSLQYVCVPSVVFNPLQPHGVGPSRLLCLWDFSGKNTAMGFHFLLQGIFATQGLNPCLLELLHCKQILYC